MATVAPGRSGRSRAGVVCLAIVALALAVAAGWWAARATLTPSVDPAAETGASQTVWADATQASIGRSLPLSTTLRQPARAVAVNGLSGVVTQVTPGEVDVGDPVYAVAGSPVRVVQGEVPFYRDLAKDLTGDDVAQLQQALTDLGYLKDKNDGTFGAATEQAVKKWQADLGIPKTGMVALGELVAVSALPTVVQLGESIVLGGNVGGGEQAVLAPTGERQFVLVVTGEQARLIPAEATVDVTFEEQTWTAVIAGSTQDEFGSTEFELTAPDGGPVCREQCDILPDDAQVTLRSEVVIVPRTEGVGVPAAAVRTRADGTAYVTTETGKQDVTVTGSGQGIAIVDGIQEGTQVQVLGGAAPAAPAPAPAPADEGTTETGEP